MPKSTAAHSALIRKAAPADQLENLANVVQAIRGIHHVEIFYDRNWDAQVGLYVNNGWRRLRVRGTDRAVLASKNLIAFSGLQEVDPNADHDHAACIASARKMGVPEAWAHRPETYLSM